MNEKQKSQLIAEAENVEAIRDFFEGWYSVETLYETAAKCTNNLLGLISRQQICDEERKDFENFKTYTAVTSCKNNVLFFNHNIFSFYI